MENKLGTAATVATVAGVTVAVCNPVGAAVLIAGGIAAGVKSAANDTSYHSSGGGWGSNEPWLPVAQYILIWTGVAEWVFSVVLFGASLMCAPGCGVDAVSGLWISLLLFVVGTVSTGVGFVYSGIFPDKSIAEEKSETSVREHREMSTSMRASLHLPDTALSTVTQPCTSLVKPVNAVAQTAKPLATPKRNLLASDDDGQTWFVVIDTTDSTVPIESGSVLPLRAKAESLK